MVKDGQAVNKLISELKTQYSKLCFFFFSVKNVWNITLQQLWEDVSSDWNSLRAMPYEL